MIINIYMCNQVYEPCATSSHVHRSGNSCIMSYLYFFRIMLYIRCYINFNTYFFIHIILIYSHIYIVFILFSISYRIFFYHILVIFSVSYSYIVVVWYPTLSNLHVQTYDLAKSNYKNNNTRLRSSGGGDMKNFNNWKWHPLNWI